MPRKRSKSVARLAVHGKRAVESLPATQQDARERALEALSYMRSEGLSLRAAASRAQTSPRAMARYVGSALRRKPNGRYAAMPSDRLYRAMRFITPHGLVVVDVTSSRAASTIARYSGAVHRYLETGDASMLTTYEGKVLHVGKRTYPFVTDRRVLERLGHAGEVSFEDLYARTRAPSYDT